MKNKFIMTISVIFFCILSTVVLASENIYKLSHEDGLYIVKIDMNNAKIVPYVADGLENVYRIALNTNASVAVNTGFFDAKNKKTVSYITENGKILANPKDNINLMTNESLKQNLDKILNRGELRIMECNNKIVADIVNHSEANNTNCKILSTTQAGPIMLPEMDLEKEYFITKENGKIVRDSIGATRKTDRSMVGIKGDYLYLIITDENTQLTINELRDKILKYNFDKAMGFDGGGSVSLFVKQRYGYFYQERDEQGASRAVKSALIVY